MKKMILAGVIGLVAFSTEAVLDGTAMAQPAAKSKASADKWRAYAKIQIEDATNELPTAELARAKLSEDLGKLEAEFNTRKPKMEPADVKRCENQLAAGKAKVTLISNTLKKAQGELDKASKLFSASSNAYALGLWGVAGNKATEADIEGGNANRRIERSLELLDVGYEHWAVVDKLLAKYRTGMENDG